MSGARSGPAPVTSPSAAQSSAQPKPPPAYSQSANQTQPPLQPQAQPLPLKAQPAMRTAQPPPHMQMPSQQIPQQPRSQYTSPIPDRAPQLPSPVIRAPSYGTQNGAPQSQPVPYRGPAQQPVHPGLHTQKSQQALAAAAAMQNGGYGQSQNRSQYSTQSQPLPQNQPQYQRNVQNGNYAAAPPQQQQPRYQSDPAKRVFGESLDELFRRDELPVPLVVSQCIQAIDLFGLQTEGIYRLSGNTVHINQLKEVFNTGMIAVTAHP